MGKKKQIGEIITILGEIANNIKQLNKENSDINISLNKSDCYHFDAKSNSLTAVENVNKIDFELLLGIDNVSKILLQNSLAFARGFSANNALLWGARGMGKSSLIKSVHAKIVDELAESDKRLILVEINREDLSFLPNLMRSLAREAAQFIIFCDDLSFDKDESSYKSLKTVLDGGLEGRPKNVIFYATSNRRHLMAREMIENERSSAINPSEAVEEKISLSDRFGLWLGFYPCDQQTYLQMVNNYAQHYNIKIEKGLLEAKALEWAMTRGARSGRVAIQFIWHLAGELRQKI